jgi:hypothetical protein
MYLEQVTNKTSKKLAYSLFLLHEFNKKRQLYNHVRIDMTLADKTISCGIFYVSDNAKFSEGPRRLICRKHIDLEDPFSELVTELLPAIRLRFNNDIFIDKILSLANNLYKNIHELYNDMRIMNIL